MKAVSFTIDGVKTKAKKDATVLEAAREAGIYIPALCSHPDLPTSIGSCRLCVVEIEGQGFPSACITPVTDGMVVQTNTAQVKEMRRYFLKVVLAQLPPPRLKGAELQRLADYVGVKEKEIPPYTPRNLTIDRDEPLLIWDHNLCITCGRCVGVCKDVRGVGAIDFINSNGKSQVSIIASTFEESGCRFCGSCVEICPTGALVDKDGEWAEAGIPPCIGACPAGIDNPRFIRLIAQRRFDEAAAVVREKVPFPKVLGRVCFHPCEGECHRSQLNEPISIVALKRVVADREARRPKPKIAKPTNKRVAIVGSGPAGLTAGYYLAKLGHSVTIFEALPKPGGMLQAGIPEYRLPREILDSEIEEIKQVGVEIKTDTKIESLAKLSKEGYDAIFLAIGAHSGMSIGVSGEDSPGVIECVDFLRDINFGKKVKLGKRVAIIGGGNAAIDSARVALRHGAKEATIVYRRSREEMPASPEEVEAALEEGVKITFLAMPSKIVEKNGALEMECVRMKLGEPDASGRRRPIPIKGSEFIMEFDNIIAAVGQMPEIPKQFKLQVGDGNRIQVGADTLVTGRKGVFSGGDAVTGPASVIEAIAAGRKAAVSIDKFLGGAGDIDEKLVEIEEPNPRLGPGHGLFDMHRAQMPRLAVKKRGLHTRQSGGFAEVDLGLSEEAAIEEARRCLGCDLRFGICKMLAPLK